MAISTIAVLGLITALCGAAQAAPDYQVVRALDIPVVYSAMVRDAAGNLYGTTVTGGNYGSGMVFKIAEDGSGFAILHSFDGAGGGAQPLASLIFGGDGNLYGTTSKGGTHGDGTVFRIARSGAGFTVLHSFDATNPADGADPEARLTQGSDGNLYGSTRGGGAKGNGTVFEIATSGAGFMVLHSFDVTKTSPPDVDGAVPQSGLIEDSGGNFYGTTTEGGANGDGTVYMINPSTPAFAVLHSFDATKPDDGAGPQSDLIFESGGILYGTTVGGGSSSVGTVYSINPSGPVFAVLHSFNGANEGASPLAGLALGNDGNLYGTAVNAGDHSRGTVYRIGPSGSGFNVLYSFQGLNDGSYPYAGLTLGVDGNFYGATIYDGQVFSKLYKLDPSAPAESGLSVLLSFDGMHNAQLYAGLTLGSDGNFYSASNNGGLYSNKTTCSGGCGTVYKIDPSGSMFAILHSFNSTNGAIPEAAPIKGNDGKFYGPTLYGGAFNEGTAYMIDPSASPPDFGFTTLHSFDGTTNDGEMPAAGLIEDSDGNFYGTAVTDGMPGGFGTVYKIDHNGIFSVLHSFLGGTNDGATSYAALTLGGDGILYGVTSYGGANSKGTVFKIKPDGTEFTLLHSFDASNPDDGANPQAGLIRDSDNKLYGTTGLGGANGVGAVYKIDPSAPSPDYGFTVLHSFDGPNGANPAAALMQGKDGKLYGTTFSGGSDGYGTVYMLDKSGLGFTVLHSFDFTGGGMPYAGVTEGGDGNFYGTTAGGAHSSVIYRVCLATCPTMTLTSSHNPSTFGAPVTFTAAVTGSSPTGKVTFKVGATELGIGTLNGSGEATVMTGSLSAGIHSITASYSGDDNNSAGSSTVLSQVVNQAPTTTALESSLNPSTFGASVTFTATVAGSSPTGMVTFKDGTTELGTGTLNGSGQASLETSVLSVATHSITAHYGGDANHGPSDSSVLSQVVNEASSATTLESSPNPSTVGSSVTFTATVAGNNPKGTVTFRDGAAVLGSGTVKKGKAVFKTNSLSAGPHGIAASYSGDANNPPSSSAILIQQVNRVRTTTKLNSKPNPSNYGSLVTFTATVAGRNPTGMVTFSDGATILGSGVLNKGRATFPTSSLSIGTHKITANYGGDITNAPSISPVLMQTVKVNQRPAMSALSGDEVLITRQLRH